MNRPFYKKRFLFSAAYILLIGLSLVLRIEGILMLLIAPPALLSLGIESLLGVQFGDIFPYQIAIGVLMAFLIGYALDLIFEKIQE